MEPIYSRRPCRVTRYRQSHIHKLTRVYPVWITSGLGRTESIFLKYCKNWVLPAAETLETWRDLETLEQFLVIWRVEGEIAVTDSPRLCSARESAWIWRKQQLKLPWLRIRNIRWTDRVGIWMWGTKCLSLCPFVVAMMFHEHSSWSISKIGSVEELECFKHALWWICLGACRALVRWQALVVFFSLSCDRSQASSRHLMHWLKW